MGRLKSIHEQARDIEKKTKKKKIETTEVIDDKILEMIQKENDIIYNDDYMYFQYFGKKRVDEEGWRTLYKEDGVRYKVRVGY